MGTTSSKVEESSKVERNFDSGGEMEKESSEVLRTHPSRPRRIPKATRGEQVAAGWPAWLATMAGESLEGWIPRRADTFEKLDVIGRGTYSTVYKARDTQSGKIVALKKLRFDNLEPESVKFVVREILILRRLDHPNIIKLEGLVTSRMSVSLYLIFEYMEHDLLGICSLGVKLTEPQVKCYMHQVLSGLEHCHRRGVLHRDIKGSNVLIDNHGVLKIADFGLSTLFDSDVKRPLTSRCVTLWYRPPELLLGETCYGVAVDMWSTGCLLGEIYAGKPIMPGRTEVEQLHKIYKLCGSPSDDYWRNSKLPNATLFKPREPYKRCLAERFKGFPPAALALIEKLLSFAPGDRGTAASALESELFTTKPFACDPSSLPKYPPSKEIDIQRREKADSRVGLVAQEQKGDHGMKGSRKLQVPPAPHANVGLMQRHYGLKGKEGHSFGQSGDSAQMLEDNELQIQHDFQRVRCRKLRPSKIQVQGNPRTDNPIYSGPLLVPSCDGAPMLKQHDHHRQAIVQEVRLENIRGRIQAQEIASRSYRGPANVPSCNVDQLLEEHDRHIQESAEKWRLEKRRGGKTKSQETQRTVNPLSSGPSIASVNKVDQLLEEHDRQIQEAAERLQREEKNRSITA